MSFFTRSPGRALITLPSLIVSVEVCNFKPLMVSLHATEPSLFVLDFSQKVQHMPHISLTSTQLLNLYSSPYSRQQLLRLNNGFNPNQWSYPEYNGVYNLNNFDHREQFENFFHHADNHDDGNSHYSYYHNLERKLSGGDGVKKASSLADKHVQNDTRNNQNEDKNDKNSFIPNLSNILSQFDDNTVQFSRRYTTSNTPSSFILDVPRPDNIAVQFDPKQNKNNDRNNQNVVQKNVKNLHYFDYLLPIQKPTTSFIMQYNKKRHCGLNGTKLHPIRPKTTPNSTQNDNSCGKNIKNNGQNNNHYIPTLEDFEVSSLFYRQLSFPSDNLYTGSYHPVSKISFENQNDSNNSNNAKNTPQNAIEPVQNVNHPPGLFVNCFMSPFISNIPHNYHDLKDDFIKNISNLYNLNQNNLKSGQKNSEKNVWIVVKYCPIPFGPWVFTSIINLVNDHACYERT